MEKARDIADIREALAPRYRVLREIGRGGMARVYLAERADEGDRVAIKLLHPDLAAGWGPERFRREVEVTRRMDHPSIVPMLASGEVLGLPYYVMPYLEGESVRDLLEREGPLPVPRAVSIASQVGEALGVAHRHGVVHRDIKPSNVFLMPDGVARVSDFGIARLTESEGESITESGMIVGTAGYMSPEQAGGTHDVDERSDIYSLGCLLYEMLAGEPPFTGPTREAVVAKQLGLDPPSVRTVRAAVPHSLDRVVRTALAKVPADRYQTADDFVRALTAAGDAAAGRGRWWRGIGVGAAAATGIALVAIVLLLVQSNRDAVAAVDPTSHVLFPVQYGEDVDRDPAADALLREAFTRWDGVDVVDPFRLREVLGDSDPDDLSRSDAGRMARQLGAGWFVQSRVARVGDSVRVQAILADAAESGAVVASHSIRLGADPARALEILADALLLDLPPREVEDFGASTRSLAARRAFLEGRRAMEEWDLMAADSAFSEAARHDPEYGEAHLWTALARAWKGDSEATWVVPARQAVATLEPSAGRNRTLAEAISAQAEEEMGRACPLWAELTRADSLDHVAWYGRAVCETSDHAVLSDPDSPTGYGFRTSYHSALRSYQRAYRLHPAILASLGQRATERLGELFKFTGLQRRDGAALPPDTMRFRADPTWVEDSLAFVPVLRPFDPAQHSTPPAAQAEARRRLRATFRDVAAAWAAHDPSSADARTALARSMAMLGDASALDTLRNARELARDETQRLGMMATEVWIQLGLALPRDLAGVRRARALADSVLGADDPPAGTVGEAAGLAALTGRVARAAELSTPAIMAVRTARVPAAVRSAGPPLLTLSALGGPETRLRELEREVTAGIAEGVPASERAITTLEWIVRPATLAFSRVRFAAYESLGRQNDYLWNLQLDWMRGDTAAVRAGLRRVEEAREAVLPENRTFDALVPEASLLLEMGDADEAAQWLDPTLRALSRVSLTQLAQTARAASLVRALELRARAALAMGDTASARPWVEALFILWSDADPFLRSTIEDLEPVMD